MQVFDNMKLYASVVSDAINKAIITDYECDRMVELVSHLLKKGFIVKLCEQDGVAQHKTFFKMRQGVVFAKNRKCSFRQHIDEDGWEIYPLEFQDWWGDIIVDQMLTQVSIIRYKNVLEDENIIWSNVDGFSVLLYYIPPYTLMRYRNQTTCKFQTLKELAVLTFINNNGYQAIQDLEYILDKETTKTARKSIEWWVSL